MEANTLIEFNELRKVLEEYAEFVADEYKRTLQRDGRPASGRLVQSIKTNVIVGESSFEVTMTLEDYWKWIEDGTSGRSPQAKIYRPDRKFPPVNKILEWVKVKPNLPKPSNLSPEQFARKIAGKIYWYGTEGKPSLADAKKTTQEKFIARIGEALNKDMGYYIRKIMPVG